MYNYQRQRANLFTESGTVLLIKVRDRAHFLFGQAGAFRMQEIMSKCTGDAWDMLAAVDYLVEQGEFQEITTGDVPGQHRVFTK